ncbi:MAG TPA: YbhB/YbcL family Raf kinase inhibitor-like protein [Flavisolibacter sp.]|nr:YbhB/YbcL family Raf kinase inhibitor-like protein [Flavisolibacter sp.]
MKSHQAYQATKVEDFVSLKLNSPSFLPNGMLPSKHTCDGSNTNPALAVDHIPPEAQSLAVIVDDPDAPGGVFCHWMVWNIPVTHHINEKENRGVPGRNDFGHHRYDGPCPPSGTHHYQFKVYVLDSVLNLAASATKADLERAMAGHILAFGVLTGQYSRS